jgi:simple sugar transport system permease protein
MKGGSLQQMTAETSISKQDNWLISIWRSIRVPLVAILLALIIGAIILLATGVSPIKAYVALFKGAFGTTKYLQRTFEQTTPLIFSGLAVAFAFKAGLFNIGAQGQLLLGAITAAFIGFSLKGLPAALHIPLALLGGGLAGAFYGFIPGMLRSFTGAHEVITTIMLNYIAINITDYLADGPWKDTSPGNVVAMTPQIEQSARIPFLGPVPVGFLIAIVIAVVIWYILGRTNLGFEIRTVGLNPHAAKYAGMRTKLIMALTLVISGLLAGLGGAVETQGVVYRYQPGFNTGLGFDGITIALLGRTNPLGVIPAALLIGAMKAGSNVMQFEADVAKEILDVIQALMLFFVSADMIVRWIIHVRKEATDEVTLTTSWGQK